MTPLCRRVPQRFHLRDDRHPEPAGVVHKAGHLLHRERVRVLGAERVRPVADGVQFVVALPENQAVHLERGTDADDAPDLRQTVGRASAVDHERAPAEARPVPDADAGEHKCIPVRPGELPQGHRRMQDARRRPGPRRGSGGSDGQDMSFGMVGKAVRRGGLRTRPEQETGRAGGRGQRLPDGHAPPGLFLKKRGQTLRRKDRVAAERLDGLVRPEPQAALVPGHRLRAGQQVATQGARPGHRRPPFRVRTAGRPSRIITDSHPAPRRPSARA